MKKVGVLKSDPAKTWLPRLVATEGGRRTGALYCYFSPTRAVYAAAIFRILMDLIA